MSANKALKHTAGRRQRIHIAASERLSRRGTMARQGSGFGSKPKGYEKHLTLSPIRLRYLILIGRCVNVAYKKVRPHLEYSNDCAS